MGEPNSVAAGRDGVSADAARIAQDTAHLMRNPMDLLIANTGGLSLSKTEDVSDLFGDEPNAA